MATPPLYEPLTRRVNASAQPSRVINRLQAAEARCVESITLLRHLMSRAPRVLPVIRGALREAFALDPDTLLFTEPLPPAAAQKVHSLTERALALLVEPRVAANINSLTALSLKDNPTARLPFSARQALERIAGLTLLGTLERAVSDYWQGLADGSWLTRHERWVTQSRALFADKALIACELFQLSPPAFALVQHLIDAPTVQARERAGGAWAHVQVAPVLWPHADKGVLALPGALHLHGEAGAPHVLYLPGLPREFHEFPTWASLQCELPSLIGEPLVNDLWQCLPLQRYRAEGHLILTPAPALTDDALRHSANGVRQGQWQHELACALSLHHHGVNAPGPAQPAAGSTARFMRFVEQGRKRLVTGTGLSGALADLLAWDQQRRQHEITLSRAAPGQALRTREQQVKRWETGLLALLDNKALGTDTDSWRVLAALLAQQQAQREAVHASLQVPDEQLFKKAYWVERPEGRRTRATVLLLAQHQALMYEARTQQRLKLLPQAALSRLFEVLDAPLATQRPGSDTCVLRVSLREGGLLRNSFVVTTTRALRWPQRAQPVLWVMLGQYGGLQAFAGLDALSASLRASLQSPDGSPVWQLLGRDEVRNGASPIEYRATDGNVLLAVFKELIEHHIHLHRLLGENVRLFSEVSGLALGRQLVAQELREHLCIAPNEARVEALAHIELLRYAAAQAEKLPTWLAAATAARRREYWRLQRVYLASAAAFERRLWQVLPSLDQFARQALTARLSADGVLPGLDIDRPFIDIPDDVSAHYCGWSSQCVVGDRHIKKVVSPQRSTFSLLQLALNNLDAQAPWTEWRLNSARYLVPQWKARLTPHYLIKTLSALNVGGQYEGLIQQAFYPVAPQTGLPRGLGERVIRQQAGLHLYSAAQQGLSASGQGLFNRAMAASTAGTLQPLQLCVLRLVGHTLAHPRHIAGVLVLHDVASGHCVVYWPSASGYPALTEHTSWSAMLAELNREWALPARVKALAEQVAPGWEAQALAGYPGAPPGPPAWLRHVRKLTPVALPHFHILKTFEAIKRFIHSFKVKHTVAAAALNDIEAQIQEQVEQAPTAWLEVIVTDHDDMVALLAHARVFEIQRRSQGRSHSAQLLAAYREERLGEQREATVRGVLSFVPVIGLGISLWEVLLAARRLHHGRTSHEGVDLAFVTLLAFIDVLTTFVPGSKGVPLRGALRQLHRRSSAVFAGNAWFVKPFKALTHWRKARTLDDAVALQGPGNRGSFAKQGEQFVVDDSHRYTVYRRDDEPLLRLKNPEAHGHDELILHIEGPREWLLQADAPQPGPSHAMWRPWAATPSSPEWTPPALAAIKRLVHQAPLAPEGWQGWGFVTDMTLREVLPPRQVFQVMTPPSLDTFTVIRQGNRYYRLLPEGRDTSSQNLAFITRNQPPALSASLNINHWLGAALADQPLPASRAADGVWRVHPPLFIEPLEVSVHRAFALMTASSRYFVIERLVQLTDPHPAVTATHLLGLRVVLDKWLAPHSLGHTDDLLNMLRPLESRTKVSVYIGYDGMSPGYSRLDFVPPHPLDTALRTPSTRNYTARAQVNTRAVQTLLEQQGFVVQRIEKKPGSQHSVDLCCTHPHSNNLYYVMTRWVQKSNINLHANRSVQLTDEWFVRRGETRSYAADFLPLKKALEENRLVKIIAGIQWTPKAAPTVFFVRFGSVRPGAKPRRRRPRTERR